LEQFLAFENSLMNVVRTKVPEVSQSPEALYHLCDAELAEFAAELSELEKSPAAQRATERIGRASGEAGPFASNFSELNTNFLTTREALSSKMRPVIPTDVQSLKRVRHVISQLETFVKVIPSQCTLVFE
jgi:hypothetical protein